MALRIRTASDIGALIRDRRRARGWSQQQLADAVGVSRLWVGQMETGKRSVQLDLALRALAALGAVLEIDLARGSEVPARSSANLILRTLRGD